MWRYSKGPWLGKCRRHSRNKDVMTNVFNDFYKQYLHRIKNE
jgi:hypothetical protein